MYEDFDKLSSSGCAGKPGFVQKIATVFPGLFKDFSRTKLNFQGLPTMNVISHIVYKMHIPSPS